MKTSIQADSDPRHDSDSNREAVLRVLSAAAFIIFFQSYLVAPLIPSLAIQLHAPVSVLGLLVPAYMLPYGFSTLFYGPLSDRIGRKPVILTLLAMTVVTIVGPATARTASQLLGWRALGGITTGGIFPIGLALLGDLFPYEERGHPLGWMFGSVAGGMAFGSTLGAFLNPIIGWRVEFMILGGISAIVLGFAIRLRHNFEGKLSKHALSPGTILVGYASLFANSRAANGYLYIFFNGVFHSGIFSWLGLYFAERYHLGDKGIGLALLGYGIPGMLLGPAIGRMADRIGRKRIIPLGLLVGALAGATLIPWTPLFWPVLIVAVLSLGFDMSHPLLAGIITSVAPERRGLAMGMNAFVLFTGFGLGALVFETLLKHGFATALAAFSLVQLVLALLAIPLFGKEDSAAGDHSGAVTANY